MKESYTAASQIPVKIILDTELVKKIKSGTIPPVHVQFMPTNRCNLNCSFCSCAARNKNIEMDFNLAKKIIDDLKDLGCKAVTITGGGEPLFYPQIEELIEYFYRKKIKIGLVTNGLLLHKVSKDTLNKLVWCRISHADYRPFNSEYIRLLHKITSVDIDWAFSYVVSETPNLERIAKLVLFANDHEFTHIRLVSDLFVPEKIDMKKINEYLKRIKVDDKLVIYQGRKDYTKGSDCFICYLKPVISPDLKVYTCCGAQYALKKPSRDMPEELCIGSALELKSIYKEFKPFKGSICHKCYYENYNIILKNLLNGIKHREFI